MMFDRQDALIVKRPAGQVERPIADRQGMEFDSTGKTFREWVLIPQEYVADYETQMRSALNHAKAG